jgi:hypothetical protein
MKTTLLALLFCLSLNTIFAQADTTKKNLVIRVPDFADPATKKFYRSYADHLIKCVVAIREKNESKVTALFKNPGAELVAKEKKLAVELFKDPVEKPKYLQFAAEAYPYLKEVKESVYYKKLYGE